MYATTFLATCVLVHGGNADWFGIGGAFGASSDDHFGGGGGRFGAKGASVGGGDGTGGPYDSEKLGGWPHYGMDSSVSGGVPVIPYDDPLLGHHTAQIPYDEPLLGHRTIKIPYDEPLLGQHNAQVPYPLLGHRAPHTGRLGEPCDGLSCDSGLHCSINHHGSYTTGTCVHEPQHSGGEGQRCRTVEEGSPCDSGLRCNRVRMYPQGWAQTCQGDHHEHPGAQGERCRSVQEGSPCNTGLVCNYAHKCEPAHEHRGGNGEECNAAPPLCNANNLVPYWAQGYHSCKCNLKLYATGPSNDDSNGPKLGMPAPHLGGAYEPCRNTYPPCNHGLHCHNSYSMTATFGQCEPNTPPSPTPQPNPSPNRGSEGQRCRNGSNQCDYGLDAQTTWEHDYGTALEYPVCRCQGRLGAGAAPSGDKLGLGGVPTPARGTKGQGCRNGNDGQKPCDEHLFCLKMKDKKAILGFCVPKPKNHGGDQQHCYAAPLSPCDEDLLSSTKDGHCMCNKKLLGDDPKLGLPTPDPFFGDEPKLGLPAPDLGSVNNGCRNGSDGRLPCNYGLYCDYYTQGSALMGTCKRFPTPPTPPTPPHRHCGGVGERCCGGSHCQDGLRAVTNWSNQYGQAFQYPVCTCEQMVGSAPGPN